MSAETSWDAEDPGEVLAWGTCRRGRHPRTPESTYVNPGTGRIQCRPCYNERRRYTRAELAAGREPELVARQDRRPTPLSPAEVARLRAEQACMGCGAVRRERPTRAGTTTTIRHARGCPVARNREGTGGVR